MNVRARILAGLVVVCFIGVTSRAGEPVITGNTTLVPPFYGLSSSVYNFTHDGTGALCFAPSNVLEGSGVKIESAMVASSLAFVPAAGNCVYTVKLQVPVQVARPGKYRIRLKYRNSAFLYSMAQATFIHAGGYAARHRVYGSLYCGGNSNSFLDTTFWDRDKATFLHGLSEAVVSGIKSFPAVYRALASGGSSAVLEFSDAIEFVGALHDIISIADNITAVEQSNPDEQHIVEFDYQLEGAEYRLGLLVEHFLGLGTVGTLGSLRVLLASSEITLDEVNIVLLESNSCSIAASSGAHGTIDPSGEVFVSKGESKTFNAVPDNDYTVDRWYVDGDDEGGGTDSLMIENVVSDRDVLVTFKPDVADEGSVTHNGPWAVSAGEKLAINGYVRDNLGNAVNGVTVYVRIDGSLSGWAMTDAAGNYSIPGVPSPSTPGDYTVVVQTTYGGQSIAASGSLTVSAVDTNVYAISSADEFLSYMRNPDNYNKKFKLTADIDLEGKGDNPDGTFSTAIATFGGKAFTGRFDGKGFRIRHVKIDTKGASRDYLGLFAQLGSGGRILNLKLTSGVTIRAGDNSHHVGGIAGYSDDGYIMDCEVSGNNIIGGNNCSRLGRLVGKDNRGFIVNCTVDGSVLCGAGSQSVGGLIGESFASDVTNCWATGNIRGGQSSQYLGGLIGKAGEASISSSYHATGWVEGADDTSFIGGLIGHLSDDCTISRCYSTGEVRPNEPDAYMESVGGLVGYATDSAIRESYSTCGVSAPQSRYAAGLIGYSYDHASIRYCYYSGTINAYDYVGGLTGRTFTDCVIADSYSKGAVGGASTVGGIAGENRSTCAIENCYSTATVTGGSYAGGIIGDRWQGSITNCYFLVTSAPDNGYGTALTDSQMKQQAGYAGWNFDATWYVLEGADYPGLRWTGVPASAPVGVAASDDHTGYVLIEWDPVATGEYYNVYRSLSEGGAKTELSGWINSVSYVDVDAEPSVTYYYWVKAATDAFATGESAFSNSDTGYRVPTYVLTATVVNGHGTIIGGGTYRDGNAATLTAIPDAGYGVKAWTGTDDDSSTATVNTVIMDAAKAMTVEFEPMPCTLSSSVVGGHGTVSPTSQTYEYGQSASLLATPDTGYRVKSWSGTDNDGSTATTNSVTMTADRTVTVQFEPISCALDASVVGGHGTVSPTSQTYNYSQVASLLATPDTGYRVKSWSGTDDDTSTATTNAVTMTSNKTVTVEFEATPPTALAIDMVDSADPADAGDQVTYTISYGNTGRPDASNAVIAEVLPVGLSFVSASAGGAYNAATRTITWNVGTLASETTGLTVSFVAKVDDSMADGGPITHGYLAIDCDQTGLLIAAAETTTVNDTKPPEVSGCTPAADSEMAARDGLITLHVTDAGSGVRYDGGTVTIRIAGDLIYDGAHETSSGVYNTKSRDQAIRGICRRSGTAADYEFVFTPSMRFDHEQSVDVVVTVADVAGNTDTINYFFTSETRFFGKSAKVNSDTAKVPHDNPATAIDSAENIWVVWDQQAAAGNTDIYIGRLAGGGSAFGTSSAVYQGSGPSEPSGHCGGPQQQALCGLAEPGGQWQVGRGCVAFEQWDHMDRAAGGQCGRPEQHQQPAISRHGSRQPRAGHGLRRL